jgi:hypothetical protein
LIITYRELRLLEIEILRALNKTGQGFLDVREIIWLDVDMMAGIEYEEFPARIAEVAMWLMDHQMNMLISNEFGQYFIRLPLKKAANIVHADALETDWNSVVRKEEISFVFGNPPFIGSNIMQQHQRDAIVKEFGNIQGSGVLDYVSGWYLKAAKYIIDTRTRVAFVSTNSIVQGEQTSILWGHMLNVYHIKIHFVHRTFKWNNEARGNATVYCVIIGFAAYDIPNKRLFDYDDIKADAHEIRAKNINPYLVDAKDFLVYKRSEPLCEVPVIYKGNQPTDGGYLIMNENEKNEYLLKEPGGTKFIKRLVSAKEFLNNTNRYCFWIVDSFDELKTLPILQRRIKMVKEMRLSSTFADTRKLADRPYQFRDLKNPNSFIVIPATTSENRKYIPFGFLDANYIPSNSVYIIAGATLCHFGVLTSMMHMAWVKTVCVG